MKVRASDFCNKSFFLTLVEEAQERNQLPKGPLSWDEGDSVVDIDENNASKSGTNVMAKSRYLAI